MFKLLQDKTLFSKIILQYFKMFESNSLRAHHFNHYDFIIFEKFQIFPNQRKKASFFSFLVLLLVLNFLWLMIPFSYFYYFIFVFLIILLVYYLYHYPLIVIKKIEKEYAPYYELFYIQLYMIYRLPEQHYNRWTFLLQSFSSFSFLSVNFKEIYHQILEGYSIESAMRNLLFYSEHFQDRFFTFLSLFKHAKYFSQEQSSSLLGALGYEKDFDIFVKTMNVRITLLFFIGTFFPILFLFVESIYLLSFDKVVITLLLFYFILLIFKEKIVSFQYGFLDFRKGNFKEESVTLKILLHYLKLLSFYLKTNSPELALIKSVKDLINIPEFTSYLKKKRYLINFNTSSFQLSSLLNITLSFLKPVQRNLYAQFISYFLKLGQGLSSQYLDEIVSSLGSHLIQLDEYDVYIQSSIVKASTLKFLIVIILGILSPFLIKFSYLYKLLYSLSLENFVVSVPYSLDSVSLLFTLFFITFVSLLITLKFFSEIIGDKFISLSNGFCLFIYLLLFMFVWILLEGFSIGTPFI